MKSGIYCIKSISRNKTYVGQSVYLTRRLSDHKSNLLKGRHGNEILQHHCNKYGLDDLKFEILEVCKIDKLDERERYWIKYYNSLNRKNGFNMESGGNDGKEFSVERRQAITGEGNPMFGRRHSKQFVHYMKIKNRALSDKLSENDVKAIKKRLANSEKQSFLAKEYGVKISTINKIVKCKNWSWVLPNLNNKLLRLQDEVRRKREAMLLGKLTKKQNWLIFKNNILQAFNDGMSRKKILLKYKVSETTFGRITSDAFKKRKNELKKNILVLKKSGKLNKDIARKLDIHRTTVSVYLKKYAPEYCQY